MYSAALDTSSKLASFSVAESEKNDIIGTENSIPISMACAELLPRILEFLERKQIDLKEIRKWTVGTGPGSFTGVRVGISLIKGICSGTGAIYRGLPSSLAMALQLRGKEQERIGVVHDGRHDEAIFTVYEHNHGRVSLLCPARPCAIDSLSKEDVTHLAVLKDDRIVPKLLKLNRSLSVLECINASGFLNARGWDWPKVQDEVEISTEPVYVRPPVCKNRSKETLCLST